MRRKRGKLNSVKLGADASGAAIGIVPEVTTELAEERAKVAVVDMTSQTFRRKYELLEVNARTWGYHSLGRAAAVDFTRMLFDDMMGLPVAPKQASLGATWLRLLTDLPCGAVDVMRGRLGMWNHLKSVSRFSTESVSTLKDPLPSLAEAALIPYLAYRRGF